MTITESLALLPDSPDARALVELSSHLNDLSDAEHALSAALEVADDDPLWAVLTGYATTAYMRAFLHSQVRRPLLEMLQIPPAHVSLHETIHKFRNTTIAHSQSELVMVLPLAVLNDAGKIRAVTDMVVSQHLPRRTAEAFSVMIADVLDLVERAAQSVREQPIAAVWGEGDRFKAVDIALPLQLLQVVHRLLKHLAAGIFPSGDQGPPAYEQCTFRHLSLLRSCSLFW